MSDPWRRFAEIWALTMKGCCQPMICEAQICRIPAEPGYCALMTRSRWEKAVVAWDAGERPQPRWLGDTFFQQADIAKADRT